MADYNEFCIVAEEQRVSVQMPHVHEKRVCCGRCRRSGSETVKDIVLSFGEWEFTLKSAGLQICSIDIKNTNKMPNHMIVAEIVMWQWEWEWDQNNDHSHQQKILKKFLYTKNQSLCVVSSPLQSDVHFIIRILGKRKSIAGICPLHLLVFNDDLTISVGGQNFVVSAKHLMQISPVFRGILTVKMRRNQREERKLVVKGVGPEQFRAFLEVIDPDQNVQPNPTNVIGVLMLANRFQVNLAKNRCEEHLMNCVEKPLIKRLQLAQLYGLKKLKDSILSIGSVRLRSFYKANIDELKLGQFDAELLDELHLRLCDDE